MTFSRTSVTVEEGIYQVVVEYTEEDVGRLALRGKPMAGPSG